MKLRLAPRALAEAKRLKTWWLENRPASPDLFEQELGSALEQIRARPASAGTSYGEGILDAPIRRLLMPRTQNHVYFAIHGNEVVVVSIWGAPKSRGPKL